MEARCAIPIEAVVARPKVLVTRYKKADGHNFEVRDMNHMMFASSTEGVFN